LQGALRIVVVDDEAPVREVTSELLKLQGHFVRSCESGAAALELLKLGNVDVLFTDLSMPGMTGIELIQQVLALGLLPKERIVAVTGLAFESPHVQWLTGRKMLVLFKPFNPLTLRWCIRTALATPV
jgi:CheY-like chemotaxis protein